MLTPAPRFLALLLNLLVIAIVPAWADTLLTAYTVPVAPWTFPDSPERGIAPEFLGYLFREAKVPLHLDTEPYVRALTDLENGSNVAALLIPDQDRDGFALRLCEVTTIRSGLVYRKSRFTVLDAAHLAGHTIGVPHGTHALDKWTATSNATVHPIESIEQGLKMLQVNRLDATFLSSPGSESQLRAADMAGGDFAWQELESSPVVVYISRRSALLTDAAAMARLKAVCDGPARTVMDKLIAQYR